MNELPSTAPARADTGAAVTMVAVAGFPLVEAGDDLAAMIVDAATKTGAAIGTGDVLVVAQKVVSKAEGRMVDLADVEPGEAAIELAERTEKDPRIVELILRESHAVLRTRPGLIVVEHRLGFVLANAGIDQSNVGLDDGCERVLLLPVDPDESCRRLRSAVCDRLGIDVAVIINDSIGRAWRNGTVGTALGVAGLSAVSDLRGRLDLDGRPLQTTQIGTADEIAAAASLVQGQADEGRPVVVVRGLHELFGDDLGADLIRPREQDLFR